MTPIPQALNTPEFAEYLDIIQRLYLVDEDFKNLCDDYCFNKENIEQLKSLTWDEIQRELEYKHLSLDLEKEILEYVIKLK